MILTRSTSLSQPPGLTDIDWSHPLAKGLKYCLSAAGGPVDDVSRKGAALEVGASVVPTRHGIGLRGTQGGTGAAGFKVAEGGFSKLVPVTSPFTVFTRIYVREIGKNLIILADYSSSASPDTTSIAIETNTNNTLSAYFAVGGVQTGVTGGTLSIGWHDVAFRYNGSRYSLALNGAQVAQVGNSSPRNAGTDFRALRGGAYPTVGFSGDMIALSIHARALSDDELVRLRANPWQLFKPVQRRIYFDMGAGGGATTSVSTDLAAEYKIRSTVHADGAGAYAVRSVVAADTSPEYSIRGAISSDVSASYIVRALAQADIHSAYLVRVAVQADAASTFTVRGDAASDATAAYLLRGSASSDLSASYDIQTASGVSSSVSASYVVRGAAQSDAAAAYDLRKSVGANSEHAFMVRGLVSSDLGSAYEVQAALMPVYADIAASYSIEGPVFGGGLSPADIAAIRAAVRSELSAELTAVIQIQTKVDAAL